MREVQKWLSTALFNNIDIAKAMILEIMTSLSVRLYIQPKHLQYLKHLKNVKNS